MNVNHTYDDKSGVFVALDGETEAGKLTWAWTPSFEVKAEHVEVSSDYQDKGVGELLVNNLVQFLRENDLKVIPECSFVKSVFDKDPTIQGVLKA